MNELICTSADGTIGISSNLAQRIKAIHGINYRQSQSTELSLLGYDAAKNLINSAKALQRGFDSCDFMPRVDVLELKRAADILFKKNKIPCGYLIFSCADDLAGFLPPNSDYDKHELSAVYGPSIAQFLFLTYIKRTNKFYAFKYNKCSRKYDYFTVKIIYT